MAPLIPKNRQGEVGSPGLASVNGYPETWEETPEWIWPNSVRVADIMRKSDGQIAAVNRSIRLPILGTRWHLEGDDVAPAAIALCERDLGLDRQDTKRGRRRQRGGVVWREFIYHVLLGTNYGHMPFEPVYEPGPAPEGIDGLGEYVVRLVKLAPRMPRSLSGIDVSAGGDLLGIRQWIPIARQQNEANRLFGYEHREVTIPAERLAFYCHEREGADWTGSSILREAWKHYWLKDGAMRHDAIGIERNAIGVPVVKYETGGNKEEALALARAYRGGEDAGVALPEGYTMELLGVTGQIRDALPTIEYHDQAVGRSALAMFLNLGHDNGARSLGETFADFFVLSLNSLIDDIAEFVTEEVIAPLVALNFGPDAPYPELVGDDLTPESMPTAEGLAQLADKGLLIPDDELEAHLRGRYDLPPKMAGSERGAAGGPGPAGANPAGAGGEPVVTPPGEKQPAPAQLAGLTNEALLARIDAARKRVTDREAAAGR